jgi:hypothetical protein
MMPSRFDTGKHTAIPPPISKTTTPAINRPHRPKKEEDDPFGSMKEAKKTKKKTPPIDRPKKSHFKPALTVLRAVLATVAQSSTAIVVRYRPSAIVLDTIFRERGRGRCGKSPTRSNWSGAAGPEASLV